MAKLEQSLPKGIYGGKNYTERWSILLFTREIQIKPQCDIVLYALGWPQLQGWTAASVEEDKEQLEASYVTSGI